MSKQGLADLTTGFDAVKAAGTQLDRQAEPQLARALGMSDDAWKSYVAREMPGIQQLDAAVRVTELGRVGLAPATGQKAVGATKLFDGMVADVRDKLEPAFARQVPATDFAARLPTLANFADEWHRSTSAKSHALSDSQVALSGTFAIAGKIPLRPARRNAAARATAPGALSPS